MDKTESLSHTRWECKYHIVFIPKCRRKTLYGQLRKHLGEVFRQLAARRRTDVQATGGITRPAALYRFDPTHRLGSVGTATPAGGILSLGLPARSATLVVVDR